MFKQFIAALALAATLAVPAQALEVELRTEIVFDTFDAFLVQNDDVLRGNFEDVAIVSDPVVELVSHEEIQRRALAQNLRLAEGPEVVAFYNTETGVIVANADAAAEGGVEFFAILLHEYVHHVQEELDHSFRCNNEFELDAYRAETEWLRQVGGWGDAEVRNIVISGRLAAMCGNAYGS